MVDHIQVKRFYLLSMKSPHGQKNRADITLNETLVKKFTQSALDNAIKAEILRKKG